jgi:hypothetical protein
MLLISPDASHISRCFSYLQMLLISSRCFSYLQMLLISPDASHIIQMLLISSRCFSYLQMLLRSPNAFTDRFRVEIRRNSNIPVNN